MAYTRIPRINPWKLKGVAREGSEGLKQSWEVGRESQAGEQHVRSPGGGNEDVVRLCEDGRQRGSWPHLSIRCSLRSGE